MFMSASIMSALLADCTGTTGDDPKASLVTWASVELRGKSENKGISGPGDNIDGESFHMAGSSRM
jgi:hypothetical protein